MRETSHDTSGNAAARLLTSWPLRQSLAADLRPAIGVAERGFRVDADFVQLTESDLPELRAYPASRARAQIPVVIAPPRGAGPDHHGGYCC
jgi:hypothetical protein